MKLGLTVSAALTCRVCREFIDEERRAETRVDVALFGKKGYAVCPGCGQEVHGHQCQNYRRRVRRFLRKREEEANGSRS